MSDIKLPQAQQQAMDYLLKNGLKVDYTKDAHRIQVSAPEVRDGWEARMQEAGFTTKDEEIWTLSTRNEAQMAKFVTAAMKNVIREVHKEAEQQLKEMAKSPQRPSPTRIAEQWAELGFRLDDASAKAAILNEPRGKLFMESRRYLDILGARAMQTAFRPAHRNER